jgi:hypothetical protein
MSKIQKVEVMRRETGSRRPYAADVNGFAAVRRWYFIER